MLNSRDIDLLRSDVAANCRIWLERCRAAGLNILITNTVRDQEYQEFLYARGRTRPGSIVTNGRVPTFHSESAGLAWDFCQNIKGRSTVTQPSSVPLPIWPRRWVSAGAAIGARSPTVRIFNGTQAKRGPAP